MTQHYRAIIIGGGIVGCSVLYHLTRRGWRDCLLLERRELTSGSTWHAAGNVTYFGHYEALTRLYVDSIATYLAAEDASGQAVGFHAAGSLRLATTRAELDAYQRLQASYDAMEIPYAVLLPDEIEAAHPLLRPDGLYGAAHTPSDGHLDPVGATNALAKAARAAGAEVRRRSPVTAIRPGGDGWKVSVETADGTEELQAEHVVLAGSFWMRELAAPLGLNLPLYPLQHHEVITDSLPALAALDFEVPTVRDPAAPSNTRQEGHGFLCGVYESAPEFWALDGIPADFGEELLPPDLQRLQENLVRVGERIPAFAEAGIKTVNNGPICYTPDGCPLLGPVESHRGLWLATGFNVGIGLGGGSGKFLAGWMSDGAPEYDIPLVHPARFANDLARERCLRMIVETYTRGYEMVPIGG